MPAQYSSSVSKENMASRVRHDLLQPAAAMKILLSRLGELSTDEEACKIVDVLGVAVGDMERSVLAITDHLMLSNDAVSVVPAEFDAGALLESVAARYRKAASEHGLSLAVDVESAAIYCDKALLVGIVEALLDNAIDFTPKGEIVLSLAATDDVTISVSDCGVGLRQETADFLVTPYFTDQAERARRKDRLGLGLARASEAARLIGGGLRVRSNLNGAGVIATLTLPRAHMAPGVLSSETHKATGSHGC